MSTLTTLIIPDGISDNVSGLCQLFAGPAGENMFLTKLSQSGNLPATHSISSGLLGDEFVALIQDPNALFSALSAAGSNMTSAEVNAMVQATIVSYENPHDVLRDNNLKIISEV